LAATGLINKIYGAAFAIDFCRKGFATRGKAEEGLYGEAGEVFRGLINEAIT